METTISCPFCHSPIPVPPTTEWDVTCAKCGANIKQTRIKEGE